MDSAKLNDWLQVIGIFAVVASLIFVGLQMKQSQEIALSAAYSARADTSIALSIEANTNPLNVSGMEKVLTGDIQDLSYAENSAVWGFLYASMTMFENHHYQYELGFLPEGHWIRNLVDLRCTLSVPYFRNAVETMDLRPSFKAAVDEVLASAKVNPSDCWEWVQDD